MPSGLPATSEGMLEPTTMEVRRQITTGLKQSKGAVLRESHQLDRKDPEVLKDIGTFTGDYNADGRNGTRNHLD